VTDAKSQLNAKRPRLEEEAGTAGGEPGPDPVTFNLLFLTGNLGVLAFGFRDIRNREDQRMIRPARHRKTLWAVRACIAASAVLLGAGLAGPCMAILPSFGHYEGWVRLFKPDLARPTRYSVIGGITTLIENGSVGLGVLLLAFSVVFPTVKLAVMAAATSALAQGRSSGPLMTFAHHAGKFSMLDVFVVALIVLGIKALPGGARVTLGWGVGAFAASVVLGMLAAMAIVYVEHRRVRVGADRHDGASAAPVTTHV
jgi:paraquat-inducible protein A